MDRAGRNSPEAVSTEELLAVAQRVFTNEGFGASTEQIARAARVGACTILDRFGGKGGLFLAAMTPPIDELEQFLGGLSSEGDLSSQFQETSLRLFDYFRELAPILFVLAHDLEFDYEASLRRRPSAPQLRLQGMLKEFLSSHRENHPVDRDAIDAAVLNLFSTLHSLAFLEALGAHGGCCSEEIIRGQAGFILRGLRGDVSVPAL